MEDTYIYIPPFYQFFLMNAFINILLTRPCNYDYIPRVFTRQKKRFRYI
jgi:hypothetical protein